VTDTRASHEVASADAFSSWCCSYCSGPLARRPHGLVCTAEGRYFATDRGVHRLLPEGRYAETRAFLELYQRVRRDEGWRAEPGLPDVGKEHPHAAVWQARALRFRAGIALLRSALRPGPWRVLDVGAGSCWASIRLAEAGHDAVAVDINLDADDGLHAAERLLPAGRRLERAEAEMSALPLEAQCFDAVVAAGSLHYAASLPRTLVELRRVVRRDGALLVLDSPVYRHRPDGEAMVAQRMRRHSQRYGVDIPRESQSGYFVLGELAHTFASAGWRLELHGWPSWPREQLRDVLEIARHGRRTARFPILLARRDG
jgi:SAM-dependent methyltransferase